MAVYHTVNGQSYSVTADGTDATVSNGSGLNQTVKAGTQYSFVGDGGDVTVSGPHHFIQLKSPFGSVSGNGGGGGGGGDVYKARDNDFTGDNSFAGETLFTGPVEFDTDLAIGNGISGTRAEWRVQLGDTRHEGRIDESTTGYSVFVGVYPDRTADGLVDAINNQSSLGFIVEAVKVSESELKLVARHPGADKNSYVFTASSEADDPPFGSGDLVRTVDGTTETPATTYTATLNGQQMLSLGDLSRSVTPYSQYPVTSEGVFRALLAKQDVLAWDAVPTNHSTNPVYSGAVYNALQSKQNTLSFDDYPRLGSNNPVKSGGLYPTPLNVAAGGTVVFPETADPLDPDHPKRFMHPNTLYIIWDNDLDDESELVVLPDNLMPDYFTTVELHIFNHADTPISIQWPTGWHWYDPASDSYKKDTEGHVYSPVLTGRSCTCITIRCSVFENTHFTPTMEIVPFVMAEVAYIHQMQDEDPGTDTDPGTDPGTDTDPGTNTSAY